MKVLRARALNEMALTVIWKRRGLLSFLYAKAYKQHTQTSNKYITCIPEMCWIQLILEVF